VADAAFKAEVSIKLDNLIGVVEEIRADARIMASSHNKLYLKVAGISGGMSVLILILGKVLF
jgi:hypothetical protein